jgi:hypothetical protein
MDKALDSIPKTALEKNAKRMIPHVQISAHQNHGILPLGSKDKFSAFFFFPAFKCIPDRPISLGVSK